MNKKNTAILMILGLFGLSYISGSDEGTEGRLAEILRRRVRLKGKSPNQAYLPNPDDKKTHHTQVGIPVYSFIDEECALQDGQCNNVVYNLAVLTAPQSLNTQPIGNIFGDKIYLETANRSTEPQKAKQWQPVTIPSGAVCYLVKCDNKVVKLDANQTLHTIQK